MSEEMAKVKKPFYKRWWFITIVAIFILGAIGSFLEDDEDLAEEESQQAEVSGQVEQESQASGQAEEAAAEPEEVEEETPETIEEFAEIYLREELGKDNGVEVKEIDGRLYVSYEGRVVLSKKQAVDDFNYNAKQLTEAIIDDFGHSGDIVYLMYMGLVDQYGNEEIAEVARMEILEDTLAKLNFEGLANRADKDFNEVADVYYVHPALK